MSCTYNDIDDDDDDDDSNDSDDDDYDDDSYDDNHFSNHLFIDSSIYFLYRFQLIRLQQQEEEQEVNLVVTIIFTINMKL